MEPRKHFDFQVSTFVSICDTRYISLYVYYVTLNCVHQRGDAVTLSAGQRTCDLHIAGSSPGWIPLCSPCESYLHLCAFVTKQYNLVPAKDGDLFGWESNCGPGGK